MNSLQSPSVTVHLVHVVPNFAPGGAQVRIIQLMNHFGERYCHTVICLNDDMSAAARIRPGIEVRCLFQAQTSNALSMLWQFRTLLRELHPSLVLTYNWGSIDAVVAAASSGVIPIIHTEDGFGDDESVAHKSRRALTRRLVLPWVYRVIAPSLTLCGIMRNTWRLPDEKVKYICNGIDITYFTPRTDPQILRTEVVVGTVGHLRREKRQDRLIQACAQLAIDHRVQLLIAGEGPERGGLERLCDDLRFRGQTAFMGQVTDVRSVYHRLDIFGLTSSTEQMPLSVLEAMACGLPVVSTDVGDIRNMVSAANQRFITSDPDLLLAGLKELANDAALRKSIGQANRDRCAEVYGIDRMFHEYAQLYDSALELSAAKHNRSRKRFLAWQ